LILDCAGRVFFHISGEVAVGVLDVILGRDENGNVSKVNLAMIALMLWKMYQSSKGGGSAEPMPAPVPSGRRADIPPPQHETRQQTPIPTPSSSNDADGGFGELTDAMKRMPDYRRDPGAGGGGLGDILGDILGGGNRPSGRGGRPEGGGMPGGGGLGDILGDILGGGRPSGRGGQPGGPGGGLGDILGDILGGGRAPRAQGVSGPQGDPFAELLRGGGGGALGGLLGAGLGGLLQQFDQAGHGAEVQSWVSRDGNKAISPSDIETTFGSDTIDTLVQQLGVPRSELLSGLAQVMPQAVDQMTPDGRLPTPEEMSRWG
jgi:uncharacterized protein YidB (DUF937 family)